MSLSRRLYQQWGRLKAEMSKFGVVGGVNTVLDFAIWNWLVHRGLGPLTSQAISATISTTSSYFMNRYWTFKDKARTGVRREYSLFFVLNIVGLLIIEAFIALFRYGFGIENALILNGAKAVGVAVSMLFRFWSYKRWVFLHASDGEEPTPPVEVALDDTVPEVAPRQP